MPMIKKLTPIGNSEGLILDRTLLGLLNLERGAEVELDVQGDTLLVRRASKGALDARAARFADARKHVLSKHGGTIKKLAK